MIKQIVLLALCGAVAVSAVPGACPKVKTAPIADLNKAMILWWRPFRSQFNAQEDIFKCLSTEWKELQGKRFRVIDNNMRANDSQKITWNGFITALDDTSDWAIEFDASANNMKVSAQILDYIEDKYMFMYVCVPDADGRGHTQNGIIFTKDQTVPANEMQNFIVRSNLAMRANNLRHINMLPIDLRGCAAP